MYILCYIAADVVLHPIVVRIKGKGNVFLPSVGEPLLELDTILLETCTGALNVIHRECTISTLSILESRQKFSRIFIHMTKA